MGGGGNPQFKYVVKSVPLSVITVPPRSYAKHFVLRGYWSASEVGLYIKGK